MLIKKPLALIRTGPGQELRTAATIGKPTMTPESESEAGIDVLRGGGKPQIGGGAVTGIVAIVRVGSSGATTDGAENVAPTTGESEANPPAQPNPNAPAAAGAADTAPKTDATPTATGQATDAPKADGSTTQDGTQNGVNGDSKKESTSKKKKGLRKVLPW
jgi:hypothetical protein